MSVLGPIMSISPYLRSAMVWFSLELFEAFVFATAYFASTDRDMESFPVLF